MTFTTNIYLFLWVCCEVLNMVSLNTKADSNVCYFEIQLPEDIIFKWRVAWSSLGCSLSWHSSLRRCQSDAAAVAAAGVGHCGGGSCRSGVKPSASPSRPAATLLSCSEHSKHTLSCLISQQRQQQPLPDICWHVAGEKIVGASQFLMQTKPSFPLHYVAVLILLVMGQHCWSYLTKAKAASHFSKLQCWINSVHRSSNLPRKVTLQLVAVVWLCDKHTD